MLKLNDNFQQDIFVSLRMLTRIEDFAMQLTEVLFGGDMEVLVQKTVW